MAKDKYSIMSDNFALRVIDHLDCPVLAVTKKPIKYKSTCNLMYQIKQKKNNNKLHYSLDNLDGAAAYITGTLSNTLHIHVEVYNESNGEVLVKWKYPHSNNDQIKTMKAIKSMLKSMQVIVD